MADKIIVCNIKIGGMWVEVHEQTFINTMRILCDHVQFHESEKRFVIFYDKNGYPVGKMSVKEV